jgi:anti-sigma B factor antagonist
MAAFRIKDVPGDGTCTLILEGEADLAVVQDIVTLGTISIMEPGVRTLTIDVGAVTFIDSTVIGALVSLNNLAQDNGKGLILANVPNRMIRLLQLTGLDGALNIRSSNAQPVDLGTPA